MKASQQLYEMTTKIWLDNIKVRFRLLRGVKFVANHDNNLLAAIVVADKTDDPRLQRARDAFVTMAMLIESERFSGLKDQFAQEERVLFVNRELAGRVFVKHVVDTDPTRQGGGRKYRRHYGIPPNQGSGGKK